MKAGRFDKLLAFLERLNQAKIHYSLANTRSDAVTVLAYAPGEFWEIDFLADGDIDVERYRSNGHIDDESVLEELFALWSEDVPTEEPVNQDGSVSRN